MSEQYKPVTIPERLAAELAPFVERCIKDARTILSDIPDDLEYMWDNNRLFGGGTGGATITPTLIALSFDLDYPDKEKQREHLRGTIFHEAAHTVQGWSFFDGKYDNPTAIETALFEGVANVFSRTYAGVSGISELHTYEADETMYAWLQEVLALPIEYDYKKYKFEDIETGRKFILYKLGEWLLDKALAKNSNVKVLDLVHMNTTRLLEFCELPKTK